MKNVLLIFGGKSYEHDISVVTASQIYNKTKLENINLILLYISRDNKFFVYKNKKFNLKDFSINGFDSKSKKFIEVTFVSGENNRIFNKTLFGLKEYLTVYEAVICCHGGMGEDGRLVAFLESFGISCSAGDSCALSICMNKFLFKQVMKGLDVPTVRGFKISKFEYENDKKSIDFKLRFLKFPLVLKQNNGGSSIGLFVANNKEEFEKMLIDAFEFDSEILVEKYIGGVREFNVAVIGNSQKFDVSEVDEPLKEHEVLTFTDKYLSGSQGKGTKIEGSLKNSMANQTRKLPADISDELRDKIKFLASKIFKSLNLQGIVRVDFLFDELNEKLYVCEVNAVPGSLSYYFFKENKILVNSLTQRLIEIANEKSNLKSCYNSEFSTNILE